MYLYKDKGMIQSPLNYTGGKFKLLPQILPLFPKSINVFIDLFCGGCNVGLNVNSNRVVYNDLNENLLRLYNIFKNAEKGSVLDFIYQIIDKYELSLVSKNGYRFYDCESTNGLGKYNKEKYIKLRNDFNEMYRKGFLDNYYYIMLYVLIVYGFNNQIRFNGRGEFNLPVGKRDFNKKMEQKLCSFIDKIQNQNCSFTCLDFRDFPISDLTTQDFVYVDPPYLITCATYNEQDGWNVEYEKYLLSFLDKLHKNNIRFALSNVLLNKGKRNEILIDWLNNNRNKYKIKRLDYNYSNSNYQTKDKTTVPEEVLIINY